jgi:hypothetical protein
MGNLFFIVRTFAITLVIILLMQIQWNGSTVEQKTLNFIRTSQLTAPIQSVAEAVTQTAGKWISKAKTVFNTKLFDNRNRSEKSESFFSLDRSEEYKEFVVNKAKEGNEIIRNKAQQGKEFSKKRMQKFIDEVSLNSKADDAGAESTGLRAASENDSALNSISNSESEEE